MGQKNRILHVDADSFFASCEVAMNRKLEGRPVWVGGGRRGDGIVIAANRIAKKFGVKTGMACFEAALTFTLSEATRLTGQLRREQLQLRELSLTIRFDDFSEVGGGHRFAHPQFQNSVINAALEGIFRDIMGAAFKPVRQIRIAFWNLRRLDTQPTLWGKTEAERWGALDEAVHELNEEYSSPEKPALMTGAQLALRQLDDAHKNPKSKCPFVPQREMVKKLWGTDADPLAHKSDWEKKLAKISKQHQFQGKGG